MPLSDFDFLLRDLRTAFGEKPGDGAWPEWSYVAEPIKGRFAIDPFTVPLAPSENGLSVTQIFFYYDERNDLPNGVRPAAMGDFMTIRDVRYEIIDVQKDDLGESGLQLTRASQVQPPILWDDGATEWLDDPADEYEQLVVWLR
jgi:hypothetical protein